jgi:DNA-binding transcriptional regulator LsrR (DeoR family)
VSNPRQKKQIPSQRTPSVLSPEREEELMARAAWLAYVGDLTQAQIAKHLHLTRLRVNKMLAQARARGIVQIRINSRIGSLVELEDRLCAAYGLRKASVVPTPPEADMVSKAVASSAGAMLTEHIRDGVSIGVGWGRTLQLSLNSVTVRPVKRMSVVSLLGGLTRGSAVNIYDLSSRLAAMFGAECFYIAAPIFTDTEATRDLLLQQSILQDAFRHAREIDVAFLSVGALHEESTMARIGVLSSEAMASLASAGAVGDFCGYWIGEDGRVIDHPLNRRVIGLAPDALRNVKTVILASGGMDKVTVLRAALRHGAVGILITDEQTAEAILSQ